MCKEKDYNLVRSLYPCCKGKASFKMPVPTEYRPAAHRWHTNICPRCDTKWLVWVSQTEVETWEVTY